MQQKAGQKAGQRGVSVPLSRPAVPALSRCGTKKAMSLIAREKMRDTFYRDAGRTLICPAPPLSLERGAEGKPGQKRGKGQP